MYYTDTCVDQGMSKSSSQGDHIRVCTIALFRIASKRVRPCLEQAICCVILPVPLYATCKCASLPFCPEIYFLRTSESLVCVVSQKNASLAIGELEFAGYQVYFFRLFGL